jgi:hypothetical protein
MDDTSETTVATDIPGIRAYPQPPTGFEVFDAPAEDLERFGFPPRPDKTCSPRAYLAWKELATAPLTRIIPRLTRSDIRHLPAKIISEAHISAGSSTTTSSNWSGIVIKDPTNPFAATQTQIAVTYVVPPVSCDQVGLPSQIVILLTTLYASDWIGIDGYGSPDVLQCGTSTQITHPRDSSGDSYFWIEWYPDFEIPIGGLGLSAFDRVSLSLSVLGRTRGSCFLANLTKKQSVSLSIDAPQGTQLQGNCLEWVVERPEVNGGLVRLPNYLFLEMTNCWAQAGKEYWPGLAPTGTIVNVQMDESGSSPCSEASVRAADPPSEIDFRFIPQKPPAR